MQKSHIVMNEFKIGDIVCLTFDKSKRFLVVAPKDNFSQEITVSYFSDYHNGIISCKIEKRYLTKVSDDSE